MASAFVFSSSDLASSSGLDEGLSSFSSSEVAPASSAFSAPSPSALSSLVASSGLASSAPLLSTFFSASAPLDSDLDWVSSGSALTLTSPLATSDDSFFFSSPSGSVFTVTSSLAASTDSTLSGTSVESSAFFSSSFSASTLDSSDSEQGLIALIPCFSLYSMISLGTTIFSGDWPSQLRYATMKLSFMR